MVADANANVPEAHEADLEVRGGVTTMGIPSLDLRTADDVDFLVILLEIVPLFNAASAEDMDIANVIVLVLYV
jgi:hypothetical protein